MKTYYTIYKITNNINNKFYIGMHQTKNLDDEYYGSGLNIKRAIEKYGIENFTKEYIAVFDDESHMISLEEKMIDKCFIARDDTYNIKEGGQGGWDYVNRDGISNGDYYTRAHKCHLEKMSTDFEYRSRCCRAIIDGLNRYKDIHGKYPGNPYSFLGKHHTEDTKRKIGTANSKHQSGKGNSQYGTCWIYNLDLKENKKILKNDLEQWTANGWIKGRNMKL